MCVHIGTIQVAVCSGQSILEERDPCLQHVNPVLIVPQLHVLQPLHLNILAFAHGLAEADILLLKVMHPLTHVLKEPGAALHGVFAASLVNATLTILENVLSNRHLFTRITNV